MACVEGVCGTGGWSGPLPGDPDNNSVLTATPAFGGIDVSWTLPALNPHAVAFTRIYRSLVEDFVGAIRLQDAAGSFHYDKIDNALRYYYWIRFYSINGTPGELIGPVSAVARPTIDQVIEQLTGKIDAGVLAQSLRAEIDRITLLDQAITQETQYRLEGDTATSEMVTQVQANIGDMAALLNEEVLARVDGQSALVQAITTTQSTLGDNIAQVQVTMQTNIDTVADRVTDIGALYTAKVNVNGLIGGFGIYNDGTEVEAGFDVDRFWIGRTNEQKRKPFIIEGDEVFINEAVINSLTFDKLRAADGSLIVENGKILADYLTISQVLESANYVPGVQGWKLNQDGSAEFRNIIARGNIQATSLNAATGTFSGSLSAASGTFSGSLTAQVVTTDNIISDALADADNFSGGAGNGTGFNVSRTSKVMFIATVSSDYLDEFGAPTLWSVGIAGVNATYVAGFKGTVAISATLDPGNYSISLTQPTGGVATINRAYILKVKR